MEDVSDTDAEADAVKMFSGFLKEPWCKVCVADQPFVFKWWLEDDGYKLLVSDFQHAWTEALAEFMLCKRNTELNPLWETPTDELLLLIRRLLDGSSGSCEIRKRNPERLHLRFTSLVSGISFTWKFYLTRCTPDVLMSNLTVPLLAMLKEQQRRFTELKNIVLQKDHEIQDYLLGGASLINKRLKTKPFDEAAFTQEMSVPKVMRIDEKQATEIFTSDNTKELYAHVMTCMHHSPAEGSHRNSVDARATPSEMNEIPNSSVEDAKETSDERERSLAAEKRMLKTDKAAKKKKKVFRF